MERTDVLELMAILKLYGMRAAGACPRAGLWPDPEDEVMTTAIKRRHKASATIYCCHCGFLNGPKAEQSRCAWRSASLSQYAVPCAHWAGMRAASRQVDEFPYPNKALHDDLSLVAWHDRRIQREVAKMPSGAQSTPRTRLR